MGDVFAFAAFAQSITFDGLGEDDGGLAFEIDGRLVGRVDFDRIMPAAAQVFQILIA